MSAPAFRVAVKAFHLLDGLVLGRLPPYVRKAAWGRAMHAKARFFPGMTRRDVDPDAMKAEPPIPREVPRGIPEWLARETSKLRREVDGTLPASDALVPGPWHHSHPGRFRAGRIYGSIRKDWPEGVTHVMIVPWLKRGGGDLVAIQFAHAVASVPGTRLLVVGTEPQASPWKSLLPGGTSFYDLGAACAEATDDEALAVLARLLLQEPPGVLHVFASRIGWKLISRHGAALASVGVKAYASSFCEDGRDSSGVSYGYAHHFLEGAYRHLVRVLTDSEDHPRRLVRDFGYPRDLFQVVRVQTETSPRGGPAASYGTRRVLWAGRLDVQKRPDLLAEVAGAMPDVDFHVYGTTLLAAQSSAMRALGRLPNVSLKGAYDGFEGIPGTGFGAYLYTSAWDGLPNVLLEAGARGLPVVASDAGGVREIIGPSTGWLVSGEAAAYVAALRECLGSPVEATARSESLRRAVNERHSRDAFTRSVEAVEGYLTVSSGSPAHERSKPMGQAE